MNDKKTQRIIAKNKSKEVQEFLDELVGESDRSAAILAGAFIDEHLRQLLENFMIDSENDNRVNDLLFGPLQSFWARTNTAYCLGLLSQSSREILLDINSIRNIFAHQLHGRSFVDEDISSICVTLFRRLPIPAPFVSDAKNMFLQATVYALQTIMLEAAIVVGKRRKQKSEPSVTLISV